MFEQPKQYTWTPDSSLQSLYTLVEKISQDAIFPYRLVGDIILTHRENLSQVACITLEHTVSKCVYSLIVKDVYLEDEGRVGYFDDFKIKDMIKVTVDDWPGWAAMVEQFVNNGAYDISYGDSEKYIETVKTLVLDNYKKYENTLMPYSRRIPQRRLRRVERI